MVCVFSYVSSSLLIAFLPLDGPGWELKISFITGDATNFK